MQISVRLLLPKHTSQNATVTCSRLRAPASITARFAVFLLNHCSGTLATRTTCSIGMTCFCSGLAMPLRTRAASMFATTFTSRAASILLTQPSGRWCKFMEAALMSAILPWQRIGARDSLPTTSISSRRMRSMQAFLHTFATAKSTRPTA